MEFDINKVYYHIAGSEELVGQAEHLGNGWSDFLLWHENGEWMAMAGAALQIPPFPVGTPESWLDVDSVSVSDNYSTLNLATCGCGKPIYDPEDYICFFCRNALG